MKTLLERIADMASCVGGNVGEVLLDAAKEIDALHAKIERMERQEPSHWGCIVLQSDGRWKEEVSRETPPEGYFSVRDAFPLYLGPGAQPAPIIPEGWLRAIDEALAIAHSGVVNADDTYEEAKAKLDNLIGFHVDGATDPAVNGGWKPIPEKHPTFDPVDLQLADGSVLCGCVPQADGDYWWEGPSGEVFIDPKYASVTHWRLAAAPEAKP